MKWEKTNVGYRCDVNDRNLIKCEYDIENDIDIIIHRFYEFMYASDLPVWDIMDEYDYRRIEENRFKGKSLFQAMNEMMGYYNRKYERYLASGKHNPNDEKFMSDTTQAINALREILIEEMRRP